MAKQMSPDDASNLIARIDERTARIEADVHEIKADIRRHYVTRDQFGPVRNLVYGFAGLALVLVSTAFLSRVIGS